jgi:hypothetical protein
VAFFAAALAASVASADAPPRLLVHPLLVPAGLAGAEDIEALLALEAARQPVELVGSAEVNAALGGTLCRERDVACLQALAKKAGARFALQVQVLGVDTKWSLFAMVVRDDGATVARQTLTRPVEDKKPVRGVRFAIRELLEKLALKDLNTATALEPEPVAKVEPQPAPAPQTDVPVALASPQAEVAAEPAPVSGGGARVAGVVIGIVGLGALATGGILGIVASNEAAGLTPVDGAIPREQLQARIDSDAKATAGTVLAIGGGVAAAVGLIMIIVGGPGEAAEVSVAPTAGGAIVGVRGTLP